jgi:gamma-tubulin complex component 2
MSNAHGSFKSERADAKDSPSPQPGGGSFASTSHKRTASGNPRPASRTTTEERRYENRKVTEKTYEAHMERLVPRMSSPDRAQRRAEKRPADASRNKSSEGRPKESKVELPQSKPCRI